jgi:hypothetical protein
MQTKTGSSGRQLQPDVLGCENEMRHRTEHCGVDQPAYLKAVRLQRQQLAVHRRLLGRSQSGRITRPATTRPVQAA